MHYVKHLIHLLHYSFFPSSSSKGLDSRSLSCILGNLSLPLSLCNYTLVIYYQIVHFGLSFLRQTIYVFLDISFSWKNATCESINLSKCSNVTTFLHNNIGSFCNRVNNSFWSSDHFDLIYWIQNSYSSLFVKLVFTDKIPIS